MKYKTLAYLSLLISFTLVTAVVFAFSDFMLEEMLFVFLLILNALNSATIIAIIEIKYKNRWVSKNFFIIQAFITTVSILVLLII